MGAKLLFLTDRKLQDLNPLTAGEEACVPGHSFGPAIRNYTLIHYVLRGKGTLYARGGTFPVRAGQIFVILPGEVTTYTADADDPWYYRWIGFNGTLSTRFSQLPPVISLPETFFMPFSCAEPPTRDTEIPGLIAGMTPEWNSSVSRKI